MKKSIIAAGAASVALAAMPIVGAFAVTDTVTDTITVQINKACSFTTNSGATRDQLYAFSGTNGQAATAAGGATHTFNVYCNDNGGYTVSASAQVLSETTTGSGIEDTFAYKGGSNPPMSGTSGLWHAQFASDDLTPTQIPDGSLTGTIFTKSGAASADGGETFTATYSVYVGSETPAGTYRGTIAYTLTSNS